MLLFLARLSFAAEESPTCGGGDELTLSIEESGIDLEPADTYDWTFSEKFFDWGGQVLDTTGPTTTIRCPDCVDGESHRWDVQVEVRDDEDNLTWGYAYFEQECPELDPMADDCACASKRGGGGVWLALLALAFRRRRS